MHAPSLLCCGSVLRRLGALGLWAMVAGCPRGLPDLDRDPDTGPDDLLDETADPDGGEDGPQARCEVEEEEPNDAPAQANALPLEARGCGTLGTATDVDAWTWTMEEEGWMEVRIDAARLGSRADVQGTLTSEDAGVGITVRGGIDTTDVRMVIPAPAGRYVLLIAPNGPQGGGGDDRFYEVRASVTKPPLDADRARDPASTEDDPQVLSEDVTGPDGVVVIDGWSTRQEVDHYAIRLPPGAYRVSAAVEAAVWGSPSDAQLVVRHGSEVFTVRDSVFGTVPDPVWEGSVPGAQEVRFEVSPADGRVGPGHWYALRVVVEQP